MRTFIALLLAVLIHTHAHAQPLIDNSTVTDTLLDRYTAQRDESFAWTLEKTWTDTPGVTAYAINLTSQTWRDKPDVDHPAWTHMMQIVRPEHPAHDTALLIIAGGTRTDTPPGNPAGFLAMMAGLTGSVVVYVPDVPNQPMILNGDGEPRYEDDLLAETWVSAARTHDPSWIIQPAMVESAVAAMDAAQQFLATDAGGGITINHFVVTGASKRGWTTWLTAAVDDRVSAIIPMVIDTLNLPATMRHHWGAYGFWAPAIGDYSGRHLFRWLNSPDSRTLRSIVDPYLYRDRYTMPKFLLNAAGDQYFLPDTTRYYLDDLPGPTRLRVVPNSDHGVSRNMDAVRSALGFYAAVLDGREIPALHWSHDNNDPGVLHVSVDTSPFEVTLWQAYNPDARDFRQEEIGDVWKPNPLEADESGGYTARVETPDKGFRAYFVEARFRLDGLTLPLTFTTEVQVVPDVLPFMDKPMQ